MWQKLRLLWGIHDIRRKFLLTAGLLLVFRVLAHIPVPLTAYQREQLLALMQNTQSTQGQLLSFFNLFSGGALQNFSLVALGIYPYITATIVVQLLTPLLPALQRMQEAGERGKQQLIQMTRLFAIPLAFLQALSQTALLANTGVLDPATFNLFGAHWLQTLAILLSLTAGTIILIWLAELITEHGIGNGTSIIIVAGILSSLPGSIQRTILSLFTSGGNGSSVVTLAALFLLLLLLLLSMVYMYSGQRHVPVSYPTKRNKLHAFRHTTFLPMQVNSVGMIPLIFAQAFLLFPHTIGQLLAGSQLPWAREAGRWITLYLSNPTTWYYWLIYAVLTAAFTYFYTYVQWQQQSIAESLQKQGAIIEGYRPGEATNRYLSQILSRITFGGALFLCCMVVLPAFFQTGGNIPVNSSSLLIVVGVILDTLRQLNAQVVARNYSGFLSE
ncbi:protein translocase subunit secY/sec61 alpha [Thermosporothrix hazakensis]|jgi:preprotein translocase subunit SecY|uniref:Protein translocase subunit SecY n=1 Tax=Thermosporothrix hazakensis TaxID=644383 RepID=A0A326U4V0_THEHA|nr:preprotein translocase subunit SecY [Thermosporothrix hazakensis]PZW27106.1 protein translocase subunit secY/sec61 alpha [Thermosporothrix hazakensis]GCE50389.1 protein translocase subunit SecY [Thermosporothrix hazakensis]